MLEILPVPTACEQCDNVAYWAWDKQPLCHAHLFLIAGLEASRVALETPVLLPAITQSDGTDYEIVICSSTCQMALCAMLNVIPLDTVICLSFEATQLVTPKSAWWFVRLRKFLARFRHRRQNKGWYSLDSSTLHCHAPILSIIEESGCMVGWASKINAYSHKIRKYVGQEFQELEESR